MEISTVEQIYQSMDRMLLATSKQKCYVNANIKGNIESTNDLKIAGGSVIEGNITTGSISIESERLLSAI